MVGLVLVSHSHQLAEALISLVQQVSINPISIAIAAGIGDDRTEFGTDAVEIMNAIQSVYSEDGVLVLMDLGSAVLSAKLALDLLDPEMAGRIRMCEAPFVEGAIAAAVQIGIGGDLRTVFNEAISALQPKREQLIDEAENNLDIGLDTEPDRASDRPSSISVTFTLHNLHGLHARPAARFVQLASSFEAEIFVRDLTNGKGPVVAKSLNAIITLGAIEDHEIEVTADGRQANEALAAIKALVDENFGEPMVEGKVSAAKVVVPQPKAISSQTEFSDKPTAPTPISEGIAIGPIFQYKKQLPPLSDERVEDPRGEWDKFSAAISITRSQIQQRRLSLSGVLGDADAAIFDAHDLILADPELLEGTRNIIFEKGYNAAYAWDQVAGQLAISYTMLLDEYLRQRAIDIQDIKDQVLINLAGDGQGVAIELDHPVILYAEELTPTETSTLDMSNVLGILTAKGGPTSHSAILSRALGIPAVSGVKLSMQTIPAGSLVAMDGATGEVWIDPDETKSKELREKRELWLQEKQTLLMASKAAAKTKDGKRVEVFANAGNDQDAKAAKQNGAEGIGLLRTEFLFLTRNQPPTEEEQLEILEQVGSHFENEPITVRTLDVGGDKEVPFIQLAAEENPFLGVRAIRLSLKRPDLFLPQLKAILRAAEISKFRIMFPMIATLEELTQAKGMLTLAHEELQARKVPHQWPVETGIMIEIPSAAMLSPVLAKHVDFFSIGTNDLTQYTMAADRGNPNLAALSDAFHPSVLKLIKLVVDAAHKEGKWVGVCGELAGEALAAPILVGLGVDELSMNPAGIPRVKATISKLRVDESARLGEQVLLAENGAEVRALVNTYLKERT